MHRDLFINLRHACAAGVTVVGFVCLSVCLSVKPHLTSGAFVCPKIDVTYSTGNEGQKICGVFPETTLLRRSSVFLRCTASVQCEGTHSLGIGFSRFKKANNRPKTTWNTSQCDTATYLSFSVSIPCLAIFRVRPVNVIVSVFCLGYVPYISVTGEFY